MITGWRSTKYTPHNGESIWVLCSHWKENFPGSYRIYSGCFELSQNGQLAHVCTHDDYGEGSWSIVFPTRNNPGDSSIDEIALGWIPANEISIKVKE